MAEQPEAGGVTPEQEQAILDLADRAFRFGADCARDLDESLFQDEVMHTYYLFFVYGGLEWLGDNIDPASPLALDAKMTAMSVALSGFQGGDRETARGTVMMLNRAADAPALRVRQAGHDAARLWLDGDREGAAGIFKALLDDPEALPRDVDPPGTSPTNTTH